MYKRIAVVTLVIVALPLGLTSCKKEEAPAAAPAPAPTAVFGEEQAHGKATTPGLKGKVLQTMDSGGYTYIELEAAEGKKWAAVKQAEVKVGQEVSVAGAMLMKDFTSKTLDRTFKEIYFGTLAGSAGEGATGNAGKLPPGHPPTAPANKAGLVHGEGDEPGRSPGAQKQPQMDVGDALEKAAGPEGRTVAEVFKQRKELSGKPVALRGKVVKINKGILGRNWVHLQDGSGSADTADHDLTVTTKEEAKLGEVVVARGVLSTDKDFGAGYKYAVILEETKFTR